MNIKLETKETWVWCINGSSNCESDSVEGKWYWRLTVGLHCSQYITKHYITINYLYFIPVGMTISIFVHLVTILFSFFSSWLSLRKSLIFIISFFLTRFPLETWNIFNAVITKICLTWFPLEIPEKLFLYFLVNKAQNSYENIEYQFLLLDCLFFFADFIKSKFTAFLADYRNNYYW